MSISLPLLLSLLTPAHAQDQVVISGSYWRSLQPEEDPEPEKAPAPAVLERSVTLAPADEEEVLVTARWVLSGTEARWFDGRLFGPGVHVVGVTWNGAETAITANDRGTFLTGEVLGTVIIEAEAVVVGTLEHGIHLDLLPAASGRVDVVHGDGERPWIQATGAVARDGDHVWTGAEALDVQVVPRQAAQTDRGTLARAAVGIGLTVGESEITGQANLSWTLSQGELAEVAFEISGAGDDLDVQGDAVRSWSQQGAVVTVVLQEAERQRVDLDLSWTVPITAKAEQSVGVPRIRPRTAFRSESSLQLARDGNVEILPELPDWEGIASTELPAWGRGLVIGTPTAAYQTGRSGAAGGLQLLRFEPVSGPSTLVDIASYTVATTEAGRVLVRAHYAVRNDRGSHLRVVAPEGLRILGVRVAGETARPVTDGEEGWLLPLQRSVETVEGLLSFPVEVILLGEEGSWDRKEDRLLDLPVVDAPVAVSRLTLHLPPGYRSKLDPGEHGVVEDFTEGEGISYGFAAGDTQAAQADALFQEAVGSWMNNDFENVEYKLEQLREMGASNENIDRLQSNVALLSEGDDENSAVSRRVKDQAKARAQEEEVQRQEIIQEAERNWYAGDYETASSQYEQAWSMGKDLEKLEQTESKELEVQNLDVKQKLELAKTEADKRKKKRDDDRDVEDYRRLAEEKQLESERRSAETERRRGEERRAEEESRRAAEQQAVETGEAILLDAPAEYEIGDGKAAEGPITLDGGEHYLVGAGGGDAGGNDALGGEDVLLEGVAGGIAGEVVGGVVGGAFGGAVEGASGAAVSETIILRGAAAGAAAPADSADQSTVFDFSETTIEGELMKPEGALIVSDEEDGEWLLSRSSGVFEEIDLDARLEGRGLDQPDASTSAGTLITEEVQRLPARSYSQTVTASEVAVVERKKGLKIPKISIGMKKQAPAPSPPPAADPGPATGGSKGVAGPGKSGGKKNRAGRAADVPSDDPASIEISMGSDGDKAMDVTATALSVVVPAQGEIIRYQHLLLEDGEHVAVRIVAKTSPQRSTSTRNSNK